MVRILTNLRIDEVSSVDRGAGEGVRVVLMKRRTGPDYRAIFKMNGPADDITKTSTTQKEKVMNTKIEGLRDVAKQFGVTHLAKIIVDAGSAHGMPELEFFRLMQAEASTTKRAGETDAQAFDRYFSAPGNVTLRKAHAITKSAPASVQPMQVGGADAVDVDTDRSAAMEQLNKLAEEQRGRAPWMSTAQAFAKVFEDPANAALANRAHRRPAPTTSFAFPR